VRQNELNTAPQPGSRFFKEAVIFYMARKKATSSDRVTESLFDISRTKQVYTSGLRLGDRPTSVDPLRHYSQSLRTGQRMDTELLRSLADTLPGQAAIGQIVDGVIAMEFHVIPPEESKDDPTVMEQARAIEKSIRRPNIEEHNNYRKFISAIVSDILVGNVAAIERKLPDVSYSEQPIWLWIVDYDRITVNPDWHPQVAGAEYRYWDTGGYGDHTRWKGLMDTDLFLIQRYSSSWRINPPSPIEVAFQTIVGWLGLTDFQSHTSSKATQEWMIDLGEVNAKELDAFREYFQVEVLQKGAVPIFGSRGGKGVSVVKLGAASDEGLYLKYQEMLLRMIALAFRLSPRDMNISEPDNRATAGIAADLSFQRAILPMARLIIEALQAEILDRFFPGFTISFLDTEPRNEKDEADTTVALYQGKIVKLDEARQRLALPPLPGEEGDVFFTDGSEAPTQPSSTEPEPLPVAPVVDIKPPARTKARGKEKEKEKEKEDIAIAARKRKTKKKPDESAPIQLSLFPD